MADDLVVVGAGGFGREALDVVEDINAAAPSQVWNVVGVVDDAPSTVNLDRLAARRATYVGTVEDLLGRVDRPRYVVGIGSPSVRRSIAENLEAAGLNAATLVHPAATLGRPVEVGAGTVVCAGARVATNVTLGRHVHLTPNVSVGHDTTLGNFVSMNPASSVSGDCTIGEGVLVGVGAVVLNQLIVGANAVVGGGACVVTHVLSGATVKGVPAR